MKSFVINAGGTGVPLDASFAEHREACEQCREFSPEQPGSAACLCLEGSVLWKRENVRKPAKLPEPRDDFHVSKAAVKRAMRYRE